MNKQLHFNSCAISASAGCGKTEEMALRLLGMFLADTDNIKKTFKNTMASTFSRSGAKEIYNRIVELLFESLNKNDVSLLNSRLQSLNMGLPEFDRTVFIKLLRELLFAVNDLKICTIDSFMNSIVNSFFIELGLSAKPELINSAEENLLTKTTLKKMLFSYSGNVGEKEKEYRELANECKKAFYAQDKKNYFDQLSKLINNFNKIIDNYPDIQAYCTNINTDEIFSDSRKQYAWEILSQNPTKYRTAATKSPAKAPLYDVLKKISEANENTVFSLPELRRIRDFYKCWEDLKIYQTSNIKSFNKDKFSHEETDAVMYLLYYGAYLLLLQTIVRSEAMLNLTHRYRRAYNEVFYQQNKLTFNDLPRLLSNDQNSWTYDIAYRLNSRMCNYLIDEFQDTSRIQWHVLNSIFDRSDENDPFSLFIVGDVKQAIYGWRSGDRRLMAEVIKEMEQQIGMTSKPLNCSFRYGENICKALNHIFDGEAVMNGHFFPGAGNAWKEIFKPHRASEKLRYRSKFNAFLLSRNKGQSVSAAFAALILQKIKDEKLEENTSSCAIIVRTKSAGLNLLEYLSQDPQYGKYFIWEGKQKIGNDKLINALLNLLIYIQHPADTMARELTAMLPAMRFLIPATPAKTAEENNRLLHGGFYQYIKECISKLLKNSENCLSFADRESIELFMQSAYEFDQTSMVHDSRLFKEYIEKVEHSSEAIGYKIPIMTIHHSKGLTYDHVFCAIADGISAINRDTEKPIYGHSKSHDWILNSVNDEFSVFEDINLAWNQNTVESIFEEICNMYVALSRARYTMTLLLPPLSKNKTAALADGNELFGHESYFITDYITSRLFADEFKVSSTDIPDGGTFQYMYIDDCNQELPIVKPKNISKQSVEPVKFKMQSSSGMSRRRIRPSDGMDEYPSEKHKLYFQIPSEQKGKSFGAELHKILCQMDDVELTSIPENISTALRNEIAKLSSNPEICNLLKGYDECWKERSFDVIIQQNYISGCFDRVQLYYGSEHKVKNAVIIDYKSGRHSAEDADKTKRYHSQLNTYRSALSQLLQLPVTQISCFIIWTHDATLEEVSP